MIKHQRLRQASCALAVLGAAAAASCAPQHATVPPAAPDTQQDATTGTVSFTGGAVALGVGFQWGSGVLTYRGQQYPFRVQGLSAIDVGAARITATGTVTNLRNLTDFSGNYVAASAGATLAGGGGASTLRNQNGVNIVGISTTQGLRLTLAPGGINITLTSR